MTTHINLSEFSKINEYMATHNGKLNFSTKLKTDIYYFIVSNLDKGEYICLLGANGSIPAEIAYLCKQVDKKLIICDQDSLLARNVNDCISALGYSKYFKIYAMQYDDFILSNMLPKNIISTIFNNCHNCDTILENNLVIKTLKDKSYSLVISNTNLFNKDDSKYFENNIKKIFNEDPKFYIGNNEIFNDYHEKLMEERCVKTEGTIIIPCKAKEAMGINDMQSFDMHCFTKGIFGNFFTLKHDIGVGAAIREKGAWAEEHIHLFRKLIKSGSIVFDIGANIGHHSVCFSHIVGPAGRVYSFEPQLPIFCLLCANAMINNCENIHPNRMVVGAENGLVEMPYLNYETDNNFGAVCLENKVSSIGVPETTIDEFIAKNKSEIKSIDFIKIDVQTFEKFVLLGSKSTLMIYKPTLFIEISPYWMKKINNYDYRDIYNFLQLLGYHFFTPQLEIVNSVPEYKLDESNSSVEWDVLAVHGDSDLYNKLISNNI